MKLKKSQLKELIKHAIVDIMSEDDSDKYTHIGYGKYKEKGKEKDKSAPTFKKTDSGKFVPLKGSDSKGKEKPKDTPKTTKIKADPFGDKGRAADDEADDIDRDARFAADDDEVDVGGPSYANVPKGAKSSTQAKIMKQNNKVAKEQGFKNTEDLFSNGDNTDIDEFINQTLQGEDFDKGEELLKKIRQIGYEHSFSLGTGSKYDKIIDGHKKEILDLVKGKEEKPKYRHPAMNDLDWDEEIPPEDLEAFVDDNKEKIARSSQKRVYDLLDKIQAAHDKEDYDDAVFHQKRLQKTLDSYMQITRDDKKAMSVADTPKSIKDIESDGDEQAWADQWDDVESDFENAKDKKRLGRISFDDYHKIKKKHDKFRKVGADNDWLDESIKESKQRRYTVKEVRMWMKKLEENRYKKVYNSDARRVAWMVNNEGRKLDEMPISMKKKWSKAQYGRERYLAKEFLKSKAEQLAEQKLRKVIREIIKEDSLGDAFQKKIQGYKDKIERERESYKKAKERQKNQNKLRYQKKQNETVRASVARFLYIPEKDIKKAIKVVKSMPFSLKGKVEIQKKPSDKVKGHYAITTEKQLFNAVVEYLASAKIGVKTISKGKM